MVQSKDDCKNEISITKPLQEADWLSEIIISGLASKPRCVLLLCISNRIAMPMFSFWLILSAEAATHESKFFLRMENCE